MKLFKLESAKAEEYKNGAEENSRAVQQTAVSCRTKTKLFSPVLNGLTRIFHVFSETMSRPAAGEYSRTGDQKAKAEYGFM